MMRFSKTTIIILGIVLAGSVVVGMTKASLFSSEYSIVDGALMANENTQEESVLSETASTSETAEEAVAVAQTRPSVTHLQIPEPLKAAYMTSWVAGTPSIRQGVIDLIDTTEFNAVVLDIKDDTGKISFEVSDPALRAFNSWENRIPDIVGLIKMLHEKNIYVIGRISVFQDPFYTSVRPDLAVKRASDGGVWEDYKGLSFVDVGAREYWDYVTALADEAYAVGFDEINFDYVRFPSDGNMKDIAFTHSDGSNKAFAVENFFVHLHDYFRTDDNGQFVAADTNIRPIISADLFGMTTTNTDDLNIGQVLERGLPYFDYIMPMVYPSHYPSGFNGYTKPATVPYEIIQISMSSAVDRVNAMKASTSTPQAVRDRLATSQLRPWLQDFDLGATYTSDMVRAQIQATYDVGLTSWAMWDAANTYTRAAYLPE